MRKYLDVKLVLVSLLFSIILPYFQKFNDQTTGNVIHLGFPIRFLTIRKSLEGNSLFDSFDIDLGSLILSVLIVYIVLYVMFIYLPHKITRKK